MNDLEGAHTTIGYEEHSHTVRDSVRASRRSSTQDATAADMDTAAAETIDGFNGYVASKDWMR